MEEQRVREELGRRTRRRRMMLGLIQKDLAERIDMPQPQLSRLEKGKIRTIDPAKLVRIADTLHTTTDYLLSRSDEPGEIPQPGRLQRVA